MLKALPPEIVSKAGGPVKFGLKKAADVIKNEVKANVRKVVAEPNLGGLPSKSTGALEESIITKRIRPAPGVKGERMLVAIRSGAKRQYGNTRANRRSGKVGKTYEESPPTFYGHMLEYGTAKMKPHPFIRPAFDSKKGEAVSVFVRETTKRIEAVVKKLDRQKRSVA
jgi:HK97 gp10 family phage protein